MISRLFDPTHWPNIKVMIEIKLEHLCEEETLEGEIKMLRQIRMLKTIGLPIVWIKKGSPPRQSWQTIKRFYEGFEIIPDDLSKMPFHRCN